MLRFFSNHTAEANMLYPDEYVLPYDRYDKDTIDNLFESAKELIHFSISFITLAEGEKKGYLSEVARYCVPIQGNKKENSLFYFHDDTDEDSSPSYF